MALAHSSSDCNNTRQKAVYYKVSWELKRLLLGVLFEERVGLWTQGLENRQYFFVVAESFSLLAVCDMMAPNRCNRKSSTKRRLSGKSKILKKQI